MALPSKPDTIQNQDQAVTEAMETLKRGRAQLPVTPSHGSARNVPAKPGQCMRTYHINPQITGMSAICVMSAPFLVGGGTHVVLALTI